MIKTLVMTLALLWARAATAAQIETQHDEATIATAPDTPLEHGVACLASTTCEETETMTPVDQTRLHDPARGVPGNCMQAALATLLDLQIDDVPDFAAGELADTGPRLKAYWQRVDDFLAVRGLYRIGIPEQGLPGLHLASGLSPRGAGHVVVRSGWQTVHDPHPSRADLASVDRLWVLVPINPAHVRHPSGA